ncbi:MAG: RHS repeat-associated core domain-containing protein, partial [Elusimicrobiota bacterium]
SYGYDGNGNMTEKIENDKTTSYEYDYENRLNKLIFPNGSYQKYIYNHAGKRMEVEKYEANASSPTATQRCIYDALQCNNIYEINGDTVTRYVYVWPGNEMVCSVQSLGGNIVTTNYYHCDGLGSVAAVTDGAGNITGTYKYDPFGNILDSSGTPAIYGFIGSLGVRNDDTGLSLMGARYYDSFIGRFISRDPVTDMSDSVAFNKYVYCRNNPINLIDPKGLQNDEPLSEEVLDILASKGQGFEIASAQSIDDIATILEESGKVSILSKITTLFEETQVTAKKFGELGIVINYGNYSQIRQGGTISWRHNNPGNMECGDNPDKYGAIACIDERSVFPDYETGFKAISRLLRDVYNNLSIRDTMYKYAPPNENRTEAYIQFIVEQTGFLADTPISSLDDAQLTIFANVIQEYEGFKQGTVAQYSNYRR